MAKQIVLRIAVIIGLVLAYFVAGKFGLSMAIQNDQASAIWPPAGIALAAVLTFGYRVWPAILIGAFLVNVTTSGLWAASLAIAVGNTLEGLAGAYLINRLANGRRVFERAPDIFRFLALAALAPIIGATIGVTVLVSNELARGDDFRTLWLTWWLGDAAGALILAPVLVLWATSARRRIHRHYMETAALALSIVAAGFAVFSGAFDFSAQNYPVQFILFPPLVWAAFRFGARETATAGIVVAGIAIWGTLRGFGPFASLTPDTSLLLVQAFLSVTTITMLILSVVVAEHQRSQESQSWLATIVESSTDAIIGKTLDGTIVSWNHGAEKMFGYTALEAIGQSISIIVPPFRFNEVPQLLERIRQGGRVEHYETTGRHKDSKRLDVSLTISPIVDADGNIRGASTIARDLTGNKRVEERLRFLAQHDTLTGLPNRLLLRDRLTQSIAHARRDGRKVAVLFLDLDGFKHINDSLGHPIGDRVLRIAARRLQGCLRDHDSVARTGGDEFVINLPALAETNDAMLVARKVLSALRERFVVDKHEIFISGSIGISIFPADGEDAQSLMRAADTAMYHAKENGRNNFQFFTPRLNEAAQRRLAIANRLHDAWKRGELMLDYQPQIDLSDDSVFGVEALLRWRQPELGRMTPSEFVKVAEETGLMGQLDEWVLRQACAQMQSWRLAGHSHLRVAVNLSAQQLRRVGFAELVKHVLIDTGLPPHALEIEVSESALMAQSSENVSILEELAHLGVRLAIDNFGTGYSSLTYLQRFPIHTLKVDRSLVQGIGKNDNDATVVAAAIAMGHNLRLKVVAEGVETAEQVAFLRSRNCLAAQGFYYSRPLPARVFAELLDKSSLSISHA